MATLNPNDPVIMYVKPTCPFCKKAGALLEKQGFKNIEVIDIRANPNLRPDMIQKANGSTTVPQIFIGGKHIGGCDDLHAKMGVKTNDTGMFCSLF